ncbi:MAG: hypothetical protein DMF18_06255 [Verrucomicrobia bacterium]|nr:MAG: hypothetical protein DMF18_06255 [Verrucomicrobiota bacterium]
MSKQYHRPPFNEANLVMAAETIKAAKATADTTKTAGSPRPAPTPPMPLYRIKHSAVTSQETSGGLSQSAAQKILLLAKRVLMA